MDWEWNVLRWIPGIGMRHLQILFLFTFITTNYVGRQCISVTLVAMTNASSANTDFEEYDWTSMEKSFITGSFYWGYWIMQLPSGLIVRRFGAKNILLLSAVTTGVTSLLTPLFVRLGGWQLFTAVRAVQGIFQSFQSAGVTQHLAKWAPPLERNCLGGFAYAGADFGNIVAVAMGVIASTPLGWPGIYYLSTVWSAIWSILWLMFGANNATTTRFISTTEVLHIETATRRSAGFHQRKIPIPWCAIFTSPHFLAIILARLGQSCLQSITWQQLPSYLNGVMDLQIETNSLLSAIPFVCMFFTSLSCTALANFIHNKGLLTLGALRRLYSTVASIIPSVGCVVIGFLDKEKVGFAIFCFILMTAGNSTNVIGSLLNIIDLSPNHASILSSIVNFASGFMLTSMPLITGAIVKDSKNRFQWQIIFGLTAIVLFISNVCFFFLMSAELQPWDDVDYKARRSTS